MFFVSLSFQFLELVTGADPGFVLLGGALVSCSTSTPINHKGFFFWQNTSCIRKLQVISRGGGGTPCTLPLDPPLGQACWKREVWRFIQSLTLLHFHKWYKLPVNGFAPAFDLFFSTMPPLPSKMTSTPFRQENKVLKVS